MNHDGGALSKGNSSLDTLSKVYMYVHVVNWVP